jgi:hypothetical protein
VAGSGSSFLDREGKRRGGQSRDGDGPQRVRVIGQHGFSRAIENLTAHGWRCVRERVAERRHQLEGGRTSLDPARRAVLA